MKLRAAAFAGRDTFLERMARRASIGLGLVGAGGLAAAALGSMATERFHRRAHREARALLASAAPGEPAVVRAEDLAGLPDPVRRWLEGAGVVGRERAKTVRLRQRGQLHTSNDAPWMPVEAEQYFNVEDPGFVWWMTSRMMKVLPLCGRDKYVAGEGEMLIKLGGLVDLASDRGPKIDQGAMLRFLAEMIWFPSAALSPYIRWEPLDDASARATMTNRGASASAVFSFDERGRVVSMIARRYFGASGGLEPWGGQIKSWKTLGGVEIAATGDVVWHLASGDFTFFRWEITEVDYNRPLVYGQAPEVPDD